MGISWIESHVSNAIITYQDGIGSGRHKPDRFRVLSRRAKLKKYKGCRGSQMVADAQSQPFCSKLAVLVLLNPV